MLSFISSCGSACHHLRYDSYLSLFSQLIHWQLLENESQGVFDHLSTELQTLKEALGALSKVVDGELQCLRNELKDLREEVRGSVVEARTEAEAAAKAVGETTRSNVALVELSVTQLKENVHRIESELRAHVWKVIR